MLLQTPRAYQSRVELTTLTTASITGTSIRLEYAGQRLAEGDPGHDAEENPDSRVALEEANRRAGKDGENTFGHGRSGRISGKIGCAGVFLAWHGRQFWAGIARPGSS